jgi:hypothetical protein
VRGGPARRRAALTIMLTLPLAIVGAVLGLFLSHNSLAMSSMIGIILLMGLVTKNGILLVDRAIVRVREYGESPLQAVLEAGPERLRPILMTRAAMVMGMLPTATGTGEGSEFRAPMGHRRHRRLAELDLAVSGRRAGVLSSHRERQDEDRQVDRPLGGDRGYIGVTSCDMDFYHASQTFSQAHDPAVLPPGYSYCRRSRSVEREPCPISFRCGIPTPW